MSACNNILHVTAYVDTCTDRRHCSVTLDPLRADPSSWKNCTRTLLVTGLQGRKCRLGMLRKTESTAGTLHIPEQAHLLCGEQPSTGSSSSCSRDRAWARMRRRLPFQGQLGHLEQRVLHRGAIHARSRWAPEGCPKRSLDLLERLVIINRPSIPARASDHCIWISQCQSKAGFCAISQLIHLVTAAGQMS